MSRHRIRHTLRPLSEPYHLLGNFTIELVKAFGLIIQAIKAVKNKLLGQPLNRRMTFRPQINFLGCRQPRPRFARQLHGIARA